MSNLTFNTAPAPQLSAMARTADCALVVESDGSIRSLMVSILRRAAFEVEAIAEADEALARLQARAYAVVVLDVGQNDGGSMLLLEHLRERAPRTLRRVVIVTADIHVLRHGLPADVCRVLAKPFEMDELVEAVASCAGAPAPD